MSVNLVNNYVSNENIFTKQDQREEKIDQTLTEIFKSGFSRERHPSLDCDIYFASESLQKKICDNITEIPEVLEPCNLRKHGNKKDLLNLNLITYCFLEFKRLGHSFSLNNNFIMPDTGTAISVFQTEGFHVTFTYPMIRNIFSRFAKECLSLKSRENQGLQTWIDGLLKNSIWSYTMTDEKINAIHDKIHDPKYQEPVLIATGFKGHSTEMIFFKNYIFYCNRGSRGSIQEEGHAITIMKIGDNEKKLITKEFLKEFVKADWDQNQFKEVNFLKTYFNPKEIRFQDMKMQTVGNCTYSNLKAALFVLLAIWEWKQKNMESDCNDFNKIISSFKIVKKIYKEFTSFERDINLREYLNDLDLIEKMKTQSDLRDHFWLFIVEMGMNIWNKTNKWYDKKKISYDLGIEVINKIKYNKELAEAYINEQFALLGKNL